MIAIAMATYNGEKYIAEQINSILEQSYSNWVLFVHDDNSSDNTVSIIRKYQIEYPEKIIFLDDNISFGNPQDNFSYIITNIPSNYEYYMFADQDDFWLKNKIELTLNKMLEINNKYIPKIVHTDLFIVDSELNIINSSMWNFQKIDYKEINTKKLLTQNNVTGCTMMFDKNVKDLFFPIPQESLMHDWWIAVNVSHYGIIKYIEEPTIYYRQHSANSVGAKSPNLFYYFKKLLQIKKVYQHYKKLYYMLKKLGFKVNFIEIIFLKGLIIAKRIFQ